MKMESYLNMKTIFKIDNSTYVLMLLGLLSGYIKNFFIIFIIVLIHELGHVFFFYLFNYDVESVVIYPFGGVTKVNKRIHERIYKDVVISLGGIFFQILLFFLVYFLYYGDFIVKSTYDMFCTYNMRVILFNLIPIIPLDGSKLLFAISTKYFSFRFSYSFMIMVGVVCLVLFMIYNCIFKLNDVVIYAFLIINLCNVIKEYRYLLNRFYLERILYDNYYDKIVYGKNVDKMMINKFYYFDVDGLRVSEKKYLLRK